MFKIQNVAMEVQALAGEFIPKKLYHRFMTGIEGLGLTGFSSLNSNGRLLANNRHTGESRVRRAVSDKRLPRLILSAVIKRYLPIAGAYGKGELRFSLDHSQFGSFYIAWIAVSIGKGRALPVWCIMAPFRKGALLKPLMRGLALLFSELSQEQKRTVVFTMDRWFGIPDLLTWLDEQHIRFIVRIKAGTPVGVPWLESGKTVPVREIGDEDVPVTYAGKDWRFIRSGWKETMQESEPWYLLTNIPADHQRGNHRHILNLYASRFQIEEFFRDIKWIQGYEWERVRKALTLQNTLLFAALGWWILLKVGKGLVRKARSVSCQPKKRLSWFRTLWEHWQQLRLRPLFDSKLSTATSG